MKRLFCFALTFVLCVSAFLCLPFYSYAGVQEESIERTQLDTSTTYYEYDADTKTLTISGEGVTPNFTSNGVGAPWFDWRQTSIDTVIVEEGITGLGNYCLYQIRATSIELPKTLKTLGSYALSGTLGVTDWELPFGITSIGSYCFYNCSTLTSVDIPDTVTTINTRAFQGCSSLESVTIPYSVKTLSSYSFYKCTALSSVKFQNLTATMAIGSYCFAYCENLLSLQVPINATMGSYCYSYSDKVTQYQGAEMSVFENSPAMIYAQANSISYTLFDTVPVECAVGYKNTYTQDNINTAYTYSFTPTYSCSYNIYTRGDCDVQCTVSDGDDILAQVDDISSSDRNFCATVSLTAGTQYTITVSSVLATGEYVMWIYPENILSACAYGSANASAVRNMTSAPDENLSEIVLTVNFEGGVADKLYYSAGYFNNTQIGQKKMPLTCGDNLAVILVGNAEAEYHLYVEHIYTYIYIDYTLDEDGYNLYTCVLCGDQYKADFVKTPAVTVSGNCVMAENPKMEHSHNVAYPYATIKVNGVEYPVNADGSWHFNTFTDCYAVFLNQNGENQTVYIDIDEGNLEYGTVVLMGYDFNDDGYVNGKDFAIFLKQRRAEYGDDYWQFAPKFM
ncbi:MAG: leucine-rich repeat domain-containing protein [Eubacterium sp.]